MCNNIRLPKTSTKCKYINLPNTYSVTASVIEGIEEEGAVCKANKREVHATNLLFLHGNTKEILTMNLN